MRLAEIAIPDGHSENGDGYLCTGLSDALRLHVLSRRLKCSTRSGLVVCISTYLKELQNFEKKLQAGMTSNEVAKTRRTVDSENRTTGKCHGHLRK